MPKATSRGAARALRGLARADATTSSSATRSSATTSSRRIATARELDPTDSALAGLASASAASRGRTCRRPRGLRRRSHAAPARDAISARTIGRDARQGACSRSDRSRPTRRARAGRTPAGVCHRGARAAGDAVIAAAGSPRRQLARDRGRLGRIVEAEDRGGHGDRRGARGLRRSSRHSLTVLPGSIGTCSSSSGVRAKESTTSRARSSTALVPGTTRCSVTRCQLACARPARGRLPVAAGARARRGARGDDRRLARLRAAGAPHPRAAPRCRESSRQLVVAARTRASAQVEEFDRERAGMASYSATSGRRSDRRRPRPWERVLRRRARRTRRGSASARSRRRSTASSHVPLSSRAATTRRSSLRDRARARALGRPRQLHLRRLARGARCSRAAAGIEEALGSSLKRARARRATDFFFARATSG